MPVIKPLWPGILAMESSFALRSCNALRRGSSIERIILVSLSAWPASISLSTHSRRLLLVPSAGPRLFNWGAEFR